MDSKMFKVERNTPIPVSIDDLLASLTFSSIVVLSVTVKFAILVHWLLVMVSVVMFKGLL